MCADYETLKSVVIIHDAHTWTVRLSLRVGLQVQKTRTDQ